MRLISELLSEAISEKHRDNDSFLRDWDKQKLREQWILGRFAEIYNRKAPRTIRYAEPSESPDFKVYDADQGWVIDIEINPFLV